MKFVTLKYLCKKDEKISMVIVTLPEEQFVVYEEKLSEGFDDVMREYICEYDCDRLNSLEFVKVKEKQTEVNDNA